MVVIDIKFSKDQINFLKKLGVTVDFSDSFSDSDLDLVEEIVSRYLQQKGFDEVYGLTEQGEMCESILDMLM